MCNLRHGNQWAAMFWIGPWHWWILSLNKLFPSPRGLAHTIPLSEWRVHSGKWPRLSSSPFPVLDLPTCPLTQPQGAWKGFSSLGGSPPMAQFSSKQDGGWGVGVEIHSPTGLSTSRPSWELVLSRPPWDLTVNTNASPFLFRWPRAQFQPFLLGSPDGR